MWRGHLSTPATCDGWMLPDPKPACKHVARDASNPVLLPAALPPLAFRAPQTEAEAIRCCLELRLQLYNTKIALPRAGKPMTFSHLDCA